MSLEGSSSTTMPFRSGGDSDHSGVKRRLDVAGGLDGRVLGAGEVLGGADPEESAASTTSAVLMSVVAGLANSCWTMG